MMGILERRIDGVVGDAGKERAMAWNLKGQLIESCSCNMFCPCWFGVPDLMIMDQGWCYGIITFAVEEGDADGVDLGGRTFVLAGHFPGPTMFDGGGTGRIFVDDGTSDEQREALEQIVQGNRGGNPEIFKQLISSWLPTQAASIDVGDNGDKVSVKVGDTGEVTSTLVRDQEGNAFTLEGGGFVAGFGLERAELAPTSSNWADSEFPIESVETKSGARGAANWSG
jgi:hypothetical protein